MTTLIRTFGGNIGIGTTDPGSYKLRVEGGVKASFYGRCRGSQCTCSIWINWNMVWECGS